MKTKELIELLQKEDPSGECDCVVNGEAVWMVYKNPGYYDGPYEQLIEDESKKPYYSVIGGRVTRKGEKVVIRPLSIEDAIANCNEDWKVDNFIIEVDEPDQFADNVKQRFEKFKTYWKTILNS